MTGTIRVHIALKDQTVKLFHLTRNYYHSRNTKNLINGAVHILDHEDDHLTCCGLNIEHKDTPMFPIKLGDICKRCIRSIKPCPCWYCWQNSLGTQTSLFHE